jgi:hypothetical protein
VTPPAPPPPPGPGPARLIRLSVAPRSISIGGRRIHGRCVKPSSGNRARPHCRRPVRLRLTYVLTTSTSLTVRLERQRAGRRTAAGACVALRRANHRRPSCTRRTAVPGRMTRTGVSGTHSIALPAFAGHTLVRGRYRLTVTAGTGGAKATEFTITS